MTDISPWEDRQCPLTQGNVVIKKLAKGDQQAKRETNSMLAGNRGMEERSLRSLKLKRIGERPDLLK
ncbi:7230a046-7ef2-49c3-b895-b552825ed3fe [Thermothielavioides terrestris]|uniref:7230a046-7ef2-49c3-b895-b552825ed3fe n=1 Tax=Thermothielavioides terrestris TaxID=2587410 RepID=A0A3S4BPY4_9PEZI|nr:7230a046-7ef2-49c3-b895-b552825ed3fe [Thermothielavioides terrestris]